MSSTAHRTVWQTSAAVQTLRLCLLTAILEGADFCNRPVWPRGACRANWPCPFHPDGALRVRFAGRWPSRMTFRPCSKTLFPSNLANACRAW